MSARVLSLCGWRVDYGGQAVVHWPQGTIAQSRFVVFHRKRHGNYESALTKWRIPTSKLLLPFKDDPLASVNLLDDEHLARIEQLVCRYKPLAVFVDSLRGAHDTDENNSRVGKVLQNLGAIASAHQGGCHSRASQPGA